MLLNQADLQSATWVKIKAHFTERLQDHRIQNDSARLTDIDTARLRGRIAEAAYVLDLATPTPAIPAK